MGEDEFVERWRAWREQREARLRAPHGFLSITGMYWLGPEPQRFDGVPGAWSAGPDGVVDAARDERLSVDDNEPVGPGHLLPEDVDEDGRMVGVDDDGGLWLVFSDATSGQMTYGAGRQLSAPVPAADGTVVLDFNRTTNLPCA